MVPKSPLSAISSGCPVNVSVDFGTSDKSKSKSEPVESASCVGGELRMGGVFKPEDSSSFSSISAAAETGELLKEPI